MTELGEELLSYHRDEDYKIIRLRDDLISAVRYAFMERYTLTLGASNLFNTYPDKIAATASNPIFTLTNGLADGQVYPRSGGPFGINGGFWYASVRVQF